MVYKDKSTNPRDGFSHYKVMSSPIGWAIAQNDQCICKPNLLLQLIFVTEKKSQATAGYGFCKQSTSVRYCEVNQGLFSVSCSE